MTELEDAAGEVAPNAEIDQALGDLRTSYVAPRQPHLALMTKEE